MVDTLLLCLYAIVTLVVFAVVGWIVLSVLQRRGSTIGTLVSNGGKVLTVLAEKAITQGATILSGAWDFVQTIAVEIQRTLNTIVDSFQRISETLGAAIIDRIDSLVGSVTVYLNEFTHYINSTFANLVIPLTDAVDRVFNTIVQYITMLVGTYNPNTC